MTRIVHPARFAPSRYAYALPRLVAFLVARNRHADAPETSDLALSFSHDQSALENNAISAIFYAIPFALILANGRLDTPLRTVLTVTAAIVLPCVLWSVSVVGLGLVISAVRSAGMGRHASQQRIACLVQHLVLVLLCLAALHSGNGASRIIGGAWLAVLALNAVAALILVLIRHRVKEVDEAMKRCVVRF